MAMKRMFSLNVVDADSFIDMPVSTQNLYFHLCMRADDDGFVDSPKKIARFVGGSDDDLKILTMKGYIIIFKSGIIAIRHWNINNTIRKDRYIPTIHLREKRLLSVDESGIYVQCDLQPSGNQLINNSQPSGNQLSNNSQPTGNQLSNNLQPSGNQLSNNSQPSGNQLSNNSQPSGNQLSNNSQPSGNQLSNNSQPTGNQFSNNSQPSDNQFLDIGIPSIDKYSIDKISIDKCSEEKMSEEKESEDEMSEEKMNGEKIKDENEMMKKIFKAKLNNLSENELSKCIKYLDFMEFDVILYALNVTQKARMPCWNYVQKVLNTYKTKNIKTMNDLQEKIIEMNFNKSHKKYEFENDIHTVDEYEALYDN